MKKNNLLIGIMYVIVGVLFFLAATLTDSKLSSLLFGFAGAGIAPGIMMIYRYFYWNKPGNKERYAERMENEKIEQHDELKVKLRDKSGRYAYIFGLVAVSISIVAFSVLGQLEIIDNSRIIIFYLGGYLILQYIIGIVIFNRLLKKYK
ncbi:hypothetical protein HZF24_05955 [Sedimentibacter hydroxybenzoicus DSM 7310]|uniref:Uncharacterized protein n=1 Tax=Sedimentibacter hydroxybenzoicus DSM 7310 TaxID=1123245 RepID=A0A974BJ23_SEDHY|nr:hypothetical protein [Sedimentibacter hydroxybenzoicus]NYB73682.1 hypothetical protein [Sedimentibacter hydroxybenzoicus DSM 7310]